MTRFDILWMFGAATTGRSTVEPCWIEKQDKEETICTIRTAA
jgi:hypothetical protein